MMRLPTSLGVLARPALGKARALDRGERIRGRKPSGVPAASRSIRAYVTAVLLALLERSMPPILCPLWARRWPCSKACVMVVSTFEDARVVNRGSMRKRFDTNEDSVATEGVLVMTCKAWSQGC